MHISANKQLWPEQLQSRAEGISAIMKLNVFV